MLTGIALSAEARRLNIPGRSKMSAAELRSAIATVTGPPVVPAQRTITVPGGRIIPVSLIIGPQVPQVPQVVTRPQVVPFRSRNGKRKPSLPRSNRRH